MKTKPEQLYPTPKFFLTQSVFSINNVRISDRNWNCLKEKRGKKKKQTNKQGNTTKGTIRSAPKDQKGWLSET